MFLARPRFRVQDGRAGKLPMCCTRAPAPSLTSPSNDTTTTTTTITTTTTTTTTTNNNDNNSNNDDNNPNTT